MTLGALVAAARTLAPDSRQRVAQAGGDAAAVTGLTHDSRAVGRGTVFIAVRGHRSDGATFAADAIRRGAIAVVAESAPPDGVKVPWLRTTDARLALAELAAIVNGHPSDQLTVVGVTGTNGKTTTTYLLASVFDGANSVGKRIRWNDNEFRIVGVRDHWMPLPTFYDVNNGALEEPEDVYIPFGWNVALEIMSTGNTNGWKPQDIKTYQDFLTSENIWIQMWVELPDRESHDRFKAFLDNYATRQKQGGRHPRPLNNRLTKPDQWLADNDVVSNDDRVLVGLAFAFLAVCLLNTVGLLLAKFLNNAPITGVRRALGASRKQIFMQHLVEVGLISSLGAALGLALGWILLLGLRALYTVDPTEGGGTQAIAHVDVGSIVTALLLALFATVAAGLYPAWRIGRIPPASYLKAQ